MTKLGTLTVSSGCPTITLDAPVTKISRLCIQSAATEVYKVNYNDRCTA